MIRLPPRQRLFPQTAAMASPSRMPNPQTRDAPSFDRLKPTELLRFISRMEDLFVKHGITSDIDKVTTLGKYADAASEAEWQHLDSYETHIWVDFRRELINSYVEACDIERGSLKALQKICRENRKIATADLSDLMALKRAFRVEVKKLQKDPPLLSNREAVEMFLDCLTSDFRLHVTSRLDIVQKEVEEGTRPEDKYKLDDVIKAAVTLAQGARVSYKALDGVTSSSRDTGGEINMKLEQELCTIKDTLVTQNRQSESHINKLSSRIEEMSKQFTSSMNKMAVPPNGGQMQAGYRQPAPFRAPAPFQQNGATPLSGCFYCGEEGHLKNECVHRSQHLTQGWIQTDSFGRIRLGDGSPIPWGKPGDTTKERVEAGRAKNATAQVNMNSRANVPGIIQLNQNATPLACLSQDRIEDLLEQLDVNDVQQFLVNKYAQADKEGADFCEV